MNHPPEQNFGLLADELQLLPVGQEWAQRFAAERKRLSDALGAAALDIQHIGSTAIPGILAKPVLDIAVAIHTFEDGLPLVPLLQAIGYEYRGENGIPRRHYFVLGKPRCTHHLHIFELGCKEWLRHLYFRDRLLASAPLAARYSAIKTAAAEQAQGQRDGYQALKSDFIAEVQNGGCQI